MRYFKGLITVWYLQHHTQKSLYCSYNSSIDSLSVLWMTLTFTADFYKIHKQPHFSLSLLSNVQYAICVFVMPNVYRHRGIFFIGWPILEADIGCLQIYLYGCVSYHICRYAGRNYSIFAAFLMFFSPLCFSHHFVFCFCICSCILVFSGCMIQYL